MKEFIIFPLIGLFIGWLTNYIAIKLLFHPRKKRFGIQGLIPRRKKQIAEKISHTSFEILPDKLQKLTKIPVIGKALENYFKQEVKTKVENFSDEKLEKIITNISKKELKFIEISGGVLGFIVGLIEAVIITLM